MRSVAQVTAGSRIPVVLDRRIPNEGVLHLVAHSVALGGRPGHRCDPAAGPNQVRGLIRCGAYSGTGAG